MPSPGHSICMVYRIASGRGARTRGQDYGASVTVDQDPKKNILFVAYFFPPWGGSGTQRSVKFVKYLPEMGYNPLVLAAAEESADYAWDRELLEEIPDAQIFRCRGLERWFMQLPRKVKLHRLVSFWTRPDPLAYAWLPYAKRMARKIARRHPIRAIYTTLSPLSSALLGMQLKKRLGVPWVLDYRDPWTTNPYAVFPTKFHYHLETWQERRALEAADAVVVVTPTMKDILVRKYPQCEGKTHVICNGFDRKDLVTAVETQHGNDGRLRIGFTGTLRDHNVHPVGVGMDCGPLDKLWAALFSYRRAVQDNSTHSPYYLLHAVRALLDERPELEDAIELSFAGTFGGENEKLVKQLKLEGVVSVKGYVSHSESIRLLQESDVLFFPLPSPSNGERSYIHAGKLFEYLAVRKPILATIPEGDAQDVIQRARAGWCLDPRNVDAIKSLLEDLIARKKAGDIRSTLDEQYIQRFERRELTRQLAALIDSLPKPQALAHTGS